MSVSTKVIHGNSIKDNRPPETKNNAKIILSGKFNNINTTFSMDNDLLSKHMMLVGSTGCGKTTLFYHIINQLRRNISKDDVMIIFDSKGDFYNKFYREGDYVIGNSKQYRDISRRWNVFKEILADGWDSKDYMINAQEICKSLFYERTSKSSSNPFFPNAARDLLAAIIIAIIRNGIDDNEYRSEFFYNSALKETLDSSDVQDIVNALSEHEDLIAVLSYISGEDDGQSQGVISELYSIIRDVLIGVFAEKGGFSMRNFVRNKGGKVLFIEYDLSIGSVLAPIYKLLLDLALKEALGRTSTQGNVYFICDEFKLIPNMQHIDDGVNFGRSLGVKVFAGIQSMEQLFEIYGESRGKNLAAGFSTMIIFKANDTTTTNYIKNLYGKNIVLEQYQLLNRTIREEKRDGYTVEDWDLNSLKVGEAIVGLPFYPPFRFYFDMYK